MKIYKIKGSVWSKVLHVFMSSVEMESVKIKWWIIECKIQCYFCCCLVYRPDICFIYFLVYWIRTDYCSSNTFLSYCLIHKHCTHTWIIKLLVLRIIRRIKTDEIGVRHIITLKIMINLYKKFTLPCMSDKVIYILCKNSSVCNLCIR